MSCRYIHSCLAPIKQFAIIHAKIARGTGECPGDVYFNDMMARMGALVIGASHLADCPRLGVNSLSKMR